MIFRVRPIKLIQDTFFRLISHKLCACVVRARCIRTSIMTSCQCLHCKFHSRRIRAAELSLSNPRHVHFFCKRILFCSLRRTRRCLKHLSASAIHDLPSVSNPRGRVHLDLHFQKTLWRELPCEFNESGNAESRTDMKHGTRSNLAVTWHCML